MVHNLITNKYSEPLSFDSEYADGQMTEYVKQIVVQKYLEPKSIEFQAYRFELIAVIYDNGEGNIEIKNQCVDDKPVVTHSFEQVYGKYLKEYEAFKERYNISEDSEEGEKNVNDRKEG